MNTLPYFKKALLLLFVLLAINSFATTWDEPWQDRIMKEASSFIWAKVISNDEAKGVTIEVTRTLAGTPLNGEINITNFYLLDLCSRSAGHGPEFHFSGLKEGYFFVKKNEKGEYCIPTPTSGVAYISGGKVVACYRHSYHKGLVEVDLFEKTMTAIFNNYHNQAYDRKFIEDHVTKYLGMKPAGFNKEEVDTFFMQHVAMECVYHLKLNGYYSKLIPFLSDTSNFHNQVSAARALMAYNTPECKEELIKVISDTTRNDFVQVICVWTLEEFKPKELKERLIKINETASAEDTGFGGDIMDPRVCTHFPDVKAAIKKLIEQL